jgi:hypothetical protein
MVAVDEVIIRPGGPALLLASADDTQIIPQRDLQE